MNSSPKPPLVCDLDETLICSDTFRIALWHLLLNDPMALLKAAPALCRGWPAFKWEVAKRISMIAVRPAFNGRIVAFLKSEKESGREIVLCTATPQIWADQIATQLGGLFNTVIGSTPELNLKGHRKTERLVSLYGEGGFDYVGDSTPDLKVWGASANAIFAGHREAVRRRLRILKPGFLDLSANH